MYKLSIVLSALLLAVVCAAPTFATGPLDPTGDDTGFVPPSRENLKCERYMNKRVLLVAKCTMMCHFKKAGAIFKNLPSFDEEVCEDTGVASCKAKYDRSLGLMTQAICPPCLDPTHQQALYPEYRDFAETMNGMVYCDTTTANVPFGDDDPGVAPLQIDIKKCEDKFGKNVMKLIKCVSGCHRALADDVFTGAPLFNEEDCEKTDPVNSCQARFFAANSLLRGCPACLDQQAAFDFVEQSWDTHNGDIYCAQ